MTKTQVLLHKLGFLQAVASQVAAVIEEEAPMRDKIKMQLEDLDSNDPVRLQAEGRDTGEGEAYSPISQNFCSVCGAPISSESNFCPNCGNPSKRLQATAVEREQPEQPALAYQIAGPQIVGRQNIVNLGITTEIYDDQSVVILMPYLVGVTFDRLGPDGTGSVEVRLTAVRGNEEVKAAAPTSLVAPSKESHGR